jgi:hypothetical protein
MLPMAAAAWPSDALHRNRIGGFQVTRFSALVAGTGWNSEWQLCIRQFLAKRIANGRQGFAAL